MKIIKRTQSTTMGVVSKGGPPLLTTPATTKGVYTTRSTRNGLVLI